MSGHITLGAHRIRRFGWMIGACRPAFVGLSQADFAKPISKRLPAAPPDAGIQVFGGTRPGCRGDLARVCAQACRFGPPRRRALAFLRSARVYLLSCFLTRDSIAADTLKVDPLPGLDVRPSHASP